MAENVNENKLNTSENDTNTSKSDSSKSEEGSAYQSNDLSRIDSPLENFILNCSVNFDDVDSGRSVRPKDSNRRRLKASKVSLQRVNASHLKDSNEKNCNTSESKQSLAGSTCNTRQDKALPPGPREYIRLDRPRRNSTVSVPKNMKQTSSTDRSKLLNKSLIPNSANPPRQYDNLIYHLDSAIHYDNPIYQLQQSFDNLNNISTNLENREENLEPQSELPISQPDQNLLHFQDRNPKIISSEKQHLSSKSKIDMLQYQKNTQPDTLNKTYNKPYKSKRSLSSNRKYSEPNLRNPKSFDKIYLESYNIKHPNDKRNCKPSATGYVHHSNRRNSKQLAKEYIEKADKRFQEQPDKICNTQLEREYLEQLDKLYYQQPARGHCKQTDREHYQQPDGKHHRQPDEGQHQRPVGEYHQQTLEEYRQQLGEYRQRSVGEYHQQSNEDHHYRSDREYYQQFNRDYYQQPDRVYQQPNRRFYQHSDRGIYQQQPYGEHYKLLDRSYFSQPHSGYSYEPRGGYYQQLRRGYYQHDSDNYQQVDRDYYKYPEKENLQQLDRGHFQPDGVYQQPDNFQQQLDRGNYQQHYYHESDRGHYQQTDEILPQDDKSFDEHAEKINAEKPIYSSHLESESILSTRKSREVPTLSTEVYRLPSDALYYQPSDEVYSQPLLHCHSTDSSYSQYSHVPYSYNFDPNCSKTPDIPNCQPIDMHHSLPPDQIYPNCSSKFSMQPKKRARSKSLGTKFSASSSGVTSHGTDNFKKFNERFKGKTKNELQLPKTQGTGVALSASSIPTSFKKTNAIKTTTAKMYELFSKLNINISQSKQNLEKQVRKIFFDKFYSENEVSEESSSSGLVAKHNKIIGSSGACREDSSKPNFKSTFHIYDVPNEINTASEIANESTLFKQYASDSHFNPSSKIDENPLPLHRAELVIVRDENLLLHADYSDPYRTKKLPKTAKAKSRSWGIQDITTSQSNENEKDLWASHQKVNLSYMPTSDSSWLLNSCPSQSYALIQTPKVRHQPYSSRDQNARVSETDNTISDQNLFTREEISSVGRNRSFGEEQMASGTRYSNEMKRSVSWTPGNPERPRPIVGQITLEGNARIRIEEKGEIEPTPGNLNQEYEKSRECFI